MLDRKKKISMHTERINPVEFDLSSDKNIDLLRSDKNPQSSTTVTTRKQSEKILFFSSVKPKIISNFFGLGLNKKSWIDDKPAPENLGEYYDQRKNIIFGKINIEENENELIKLILLSQKKANKLIKNQSGFFFSPQQIHEWAISLKENISNYCLVLFLYLKNKQVKKANELFLLMHQQNRDLLKNIAIQIKKNFRNMSNSNRIGKFFPSIIKKFFQIISVVIKFASKFNKNLIENY